jgi:Protein of unknown function (DUF998)
MQRCTRSSIARTPACDYPLVTPAAVLNSWSAVRRPSPPGDIMGLVQTLRSSSARSSGRRRRRELYPRILRSARVAPVGLAVVMVGLTLGEQSYLRHVGWSPIRRTPTEWPSLLALGPGGWLLTAAFVVGGLAGLLIGQQLWRQAMRRTLRIASALFIAMNGALILVAFSADSPGQIADSWHAKIHNHAYPLLLSAGLISAGLMAATSAGSGPWRRLRIASMVAFPVILLGATISSFNPVAQLGRDVLLSGLIGWAQLAAMAAVRLPDR